MLIAPVKTYRIRHFAHPSLEEFLIDCLPILQENTVVAITAKLVALCEDSYVYPDDWDKQELVEQGSEVYLPSIPPHDNVGVSQTLSITNGILVAAAGVHRSKEILILWPSDPQYTANKIRRFLADLYGIKNVGVLITDSTSRPLRRGVAGIPLAHSGFKSLVGNPDLKYKRDIAYGLAGAAVACMGESGDCTPIALITDAPFIEFVNHDPTEHELSIIKTDFNNDLFRPMFTGINWQAGARASRKAKTS